MDELSTFDTKCFGEKVRTIEINGDNWLLAKDVEQALGQVSEKDKYEFLDAVEASHYLKLAKVTLYQLRAEGLIPNHHVGEKLLFNKMELYEWVMSGKASKYWGDKNNG